MTWRTLGSSRCSVSTLWAPGRGAVELDGDERAAQQLVQRGEPRADQLVVVEPQTEHLAAVGGTLRRPRARRPATG